MEVVLKKKDAIEENIELKPNVYGVFSKGDKGFASLFQEGSTIYQVYRTDTNQLILKNQSSDVLVVSDQIDHLFKQDTLEQEWEYFNHVFNLTKDNQKERFLYALHLVGLSNDFFSRRFSTLSSSEQKLIHIAFMIYRNPKILILEEPFRFLDQKAKKHLLQLFKKMASEKGKLIFLCTNHVDDLYTFFDHFLLFNEGIIYVYDHVNDLFRIDQLRKMNIPIPSITLFSEKAINKKKVHLSYHRDIRDLIKDIYKHVEL